MPRSVRVNRLDEITFVRGQQGQPFAGGGPAAGPKLDLVGASGEFLELDQPVKERNVGNREAGEVGLPVGAIRLFAAGEAGGEEIASRPGQEKVVLRVAPGFNEAGAALQLRQVFCQGGRLRSDQEQLGLHQPAGRSELHAPIVDVHPSIPLSMHRPRVARAIHQAAIGRDPTVFAVPNVAGLAVAHLVEP